MVGGSDLSGVLIQPGHRSRRHVGRLTHAQSRGCVGSRVVGPSFSFFSLFVGSIRDILVVPVERGPGIIFRNVKRRERNTRKQSFQKHRTEHIKNCFFVLFSVRAVFVPNRFSCCPSI